MKELSTLVRSRFLSALFFCVTLALCSFTITTVRAADKEANAIEGRWDMVIEKDGKQLPSWLEIEHSGNHTLVGRFVYAFGSARPISVVNHTEGKFNFSIPVQWEPVTTTMDFEGELA